MKLRFIVLLLVALFALPVLAQDSASHTISFDGFGFTYDSSVGTNVSITSIPGDPPDVEQMGGPEVPHTVFALYSDKSVPEFSAPGEIRVYRSADLADNEIRAEQLEQLQTLLNDRPDLTPYMTADVTGANTLPSMPVFGAAQILRAQAKYIDTPSVSGIAFIAAYGQDVFPFTGNSFLYVFQGLSSDGAYYIAAQFQLNTTLFPAEVPADLDIEAFSANYEQYLAETVDTLNNANPDDFTPSLTTLDALINSFTFDS